MERIESFRHSEEQSNSCVIQKKKELADILSQEYDKNNNRLQKLKTALVQDEETLKKSQARDLAILTKEHEAALAKVKLTLDSKLQLSKESMQTQKDQIEQDLFGCIDKELSENKDTWEKEYAMVSNKRIAERNEQNRKILMQRREVEIKAMLRASLEKERAVSNNA